MHIATALRARDDTLEVEPEETRLTSELSEPP